MKIVKSLSINNKPNLNNFSMKIYPSIVPKLVKDDISRVSRVDEVTDSKALYHELSEIKQHYLSILSDETLEEDAKASYNTLIYNILIIEQKLISIQRRRCYEKLKSKSIFRDVNKKMHTMEKLAYEVERLVQDIYASEQIWNECLGELTKKEKHEITKMAMENHNRVDDLFNGISTKWQTYKKVYNAMDYVNTYVSLKGRKKVTVDVLKQIMEMQEKDLDQKLLIS